MFAANQLSVVTVLTVSPGRLGGACGRLRASLVQPRLSQKAPTGRDRAPQDTELSQTIDTHRL